MNVINLMSMDANDFLVAGIAAINVACAELPSLDHAEILILAGQISGVRMSMARKNRKQAIEAIRERLEWRLDRLIRGEIIAKAAKQV